MERDRSLSLEEYRAGAQRYPQMEYGSLAAVSGDNRWGRAPGKSVNSRNFIPITHLDTTVKTIPEARVSKKDFVGSAAFNLEYPPNATREEIYDDIVSYLGEYRFNLEKFNYQLTFGQCEDGKIGLCDPYRMEGMGIKGERAVEKRKQQGQPVHREEQELIGINKLDTVLRFAQAGDAVLWASPPGPRDEGYGDYGFIYVGKIVGQEIPLRIDMTAIRVENPTIVQFNKAMSVLSGEIINKSSADEYLSDPRILRNRVEQIASIDIILKQYFPPSELKTDEVFKQVIRRMDGIIQESIDIIQSGTNQQKVNTFNVLENYALRLKVQYEKENQEIATGNTTKRRYRERQNYSLRELQLYAYAPPVMRGSCGATGVQQSNNISLFRSPFQRQEQQGVILNFFAKRSFDFDHKAICEWCNFRKMCGPCNICESCNDEIDMEGGADAA